MDFAYGIKKGLAAALTATVLWYLLDTKEGFVSALQAGALFGSILTVFFAWRGPRSDE